MLTLGTIPKSKMMEQADRLIHQLADLPRRENPLIPRLALLRTIPVRLFMASSSAYLTVFKPVTKVGMLTSSPKELTFTFNFPYINGLEENDKKRKKIF